MDRFKLTCCNCGSDNVLEKTSKNELSRNKDKVQYAEGIQRKCIDCNNQFLAIYKTYYE